MSDLNLGNSLFQGYNDQNGLMICGYEWGWSKADCGVLLVFAPESQQTKKG